MKLKGFKSIRFLANLSLAVFLLDASISFAQATDAADSFSTSGVFEPLDGLASALEPLNNIGNIGGAIGTAVQAGICVGLCQNAKERARENLWRLWVNALIACIDLTEPERYQCLKDQGFGDGTKNSYFYDYQRRESAIANAYIQCLAGCAKNVSPWVPSY